MFEVNLRIVEVFVKISDSRILLLDNDDHSSSSAEFHVENNLETVPR